MRIGMTFPHNVEPNGAAIRDLGIAVEAAGFDYLCSLDHVLGAHPDRLAGLTYAAYTHESPTHEVLTLFSHLAAVTSRIEFATTALILPQRQTALVAKQAAELQILSGGRFRLGAVIGWNGPEAEGMGTGFATRGRRIQEQVEVLRRLWSEELVTYSGRFHHIDRSGINPLPAQAPQVWLGGGYEDRLLRRVARLADGWLPSLTPAGDLEEALTRLRSHLDAEGRDPASFGVEVRLNLNRVARDGWLPQAENYARLGATHIAILPKPDLPASAQFDTSCEAREALVAAGFGPV